MTENYAEIYARDISMVLDNDADAYNDVRERVMSALRTDSGYTDMTPEDYRDALVHDGEYVNARNILPVFYDILQDIINDGATGLAALLLSQLVIDEPIMVQLAIDHLPSVEDYADWHESQD